MNNRVTFDFRRHTGAYPVTVDFSCNAPSIEVKGIDVTELIHSAAHDEIIKQAQQILADEAGDDLADYQQAFGV